MRTITLCSGKGGVGKTLIATSLGRIIQRAEHCNVMLVDLDLSVRGLTLLAFQNSYELDKLPFSLTDYLEEKNEQSPSLFQELQRELGHSMPELEDAAPDANRRVFTSGYQRTEGLFIIPSSTQTERPDWNQFSQLELEVAISKLGKLHEFAKTSLNIDYVIFDTQAGLSSLSLAATSLSDLNLIVLEEDDISWRTALNTLMEISDLSRRLHHKSRTYFLANKVSVGMVDAADKLKSFSFLPPIPFDTWMHRLFAHDTGAVLEEAFETSDFFRHVEAEVWDELAVILGVRKRASKPKGRSSWWR